MKTVLMDARLAVRGLGIASAAHRLEQSLGRLPGFRITVNRSEHGWTRMGKLDTLLRTGLLDFDPRWDPRARGVDVLHYFGNSCPRRPTPNSIVTVHDLMMLRADGQRARLFRSLLVPGLRTGRARVVAISTSTADALVMDLGFSPRAIEVIPHGYREREIWMGPREHLMMFGGSSDPRKRIELGMRAYDEYAREAGSEAMPLVVAARAGIDERHLRLVTHGSVTVESNPDASTLDTLLGRAACLLYPSAWEGYGLPILEAGELGTPAVYDASARIPREPLGRHAVAASGGDPRAFAQAISAALRVGVVPDALVDRPTWDDVAAMYGQIYEGVAGWWRDR